MKSFDDLIKPDKRSKKYPPEWVEKQLTEVPLSTKVPKKIREMVALAQELVYYGYFRYEFYNLALFYLCITFETSLGEKYRQKKKRFKKLINSAKQDGLFPKPFQSKLISIRNIRNKNAHPFGMVVMPLAMKGFHLITYLINCIFDEGARKILPPIFAKEIEQSKKIEFYIHRCRDSAKQ